MISLPTLHQLLLILLYAGLGSASMAVQDFAGTMLNVAENRNQGAAAKWWDRAGDAAKFVMLSYSGDRLMHLGLFGWLGIVPILWVGGIVTEHTTSFANRKYGSPDKD